MCELNHVTLLLILSGSQDVDQMLDAGNIDHCRQTAEQLPSSGLVWVNTRRRCRPRLKSKYCVTVPGGVQWL